MTRFALLLLMAALSFFACNEPQSHYAPDDEEQAWIDSNEVIIGMYPFYPPYAYLEDKKSIAGMFPDLREMIGRATGLRFKQVFYPNWSQYLGAARTGEIDIINPIIPTPERREFLYFTNPVVMDPHVMVVRDDDHAPQTLEELKNRQDLVIAAVEDYFITDYIQKNFSKHPIKYYVDDRESIMALVNREADVFMTQKITSNYFIQKYKNLVSISDIPANTILSIGIHKSQPMLFQIISNTIEAIDDDDMAKLVNKWSYQKYLPFYRKADFWIVFGLIAVAAALVLLIWNKMLSRRVQQKTADLVRAKEKAEESDRLKTAFVSNISHEIRTPLNAINGYSELMALEFSDKRVQQYTADIIANSLRLTNVIESIILFAQLEHEQLSLHKQINNLENIISNVVVKCTEMHPDKAAQIDIKIDCEGDISLNTDSFYLRKMLVFVVDNALKFTESGSVTVGCRLKENQLTIFVKDTGPGIDQEALPQIFEKFHKFSVFKDRFSSGTGVGLTIAKGLADKLGFEMGVDSDPGKGTEFYFVYNLCQKT